MSEELKPVQTDSNAGGNQENQNSSNVETQGQVEVDSQKVIELLEAQDKALAAAETKIVSLKRKAKKVEEVIEGESGEEDLDARIERRVQEVLAGQRKEDTDSELVEIQRVRKLNSELAASLRAKASISNSSVGAGQGGKKEPEDDPLKGLNEKDRELIERRAAALRITPQEYARKKLVK